MPVELGFDDQPPVEVSGTIANPQLLLVPMPDDSQLIDMFRRSSQAEDRRSGALVLPQPRRHRNGHGGAGELCARVGPHGEPAARGRPPPMPGARTQSPPARAAPRRPGARQHALTRRAEDPAEPEEIRLAKNFLLAARLPNARLIDTDKPRALAGFRAVWKSEDAAGAVKIIPPGPEVTGLASPRELIAVDPQLCKGNFAAARSSTVIDRRHRVQRGSLLHRCAERAGHPVFRHPSRRKAGSSSLR